MPQAKGHNALPTARALLDRALESEKGIKVKCGTAKKAKSMRMQCYTARGRVRNQNNKIYSEDHPMYGSSPYDHLELFIDGSVLIIRSQPDIDNMVEEIE